MDSKLTNTIEDLEKLFASRMSDYEDKLQKASSSTAHPDLASLAQEFREFKTFIMQAISHFKAQIGLLSHGLDRHETHLRRKVLLFHGLPESPKENLTEVIVRTISNTLKVDDVSAGNLEVCHRLGGARGKTRPVLVRFRDMEHRRAVWDSKTTLKGSGVTISEFLTKTRHRVFMSARQHFGINSCWSAEGLIVILTPDKARKKISTMGELDSLIAQFPASASASASSTSTRPGVSAPSEGALPGPASSVASGKVLRKTRLAASQQLSSL